MVLNKGAAPLKELKGEYIQLEIPLDVMEHLFTALHIIKPNHVTKLEKKALDLVRDQIYYGLEEYMETPEQADERKMKFRQMFEEQRQKKMYESEKETAY